MRISQLEILRQEVELASIKKPHATYSISTRELLELIDDLEDALDENMELNAEIESYEGQADERDDEINDLSSRVDELCAERDEYKAKYDELVGGISGVVERLNGNGSH